MRGKLIVIEGTDCSGKQTQTQKLVENLNKRNIKTKAFGFPRYDTPTGKIIGGAYLGKPAIGEGYFPEGAPNVPAKVAALYFAADRLYNIKEINRALDMGYNVVLDRYVESNMAFQGGKIFNSQERLEMYCFLESLEYDLLKLPRPDIRLFLYMPYEQACILKQQREEPMDEHEKDEKVLRNAEQSYKEIARLYKYVTINCAKENKIKSIEEISKEVLVEVRKKLPTKLVFKQKNQNQTNAQQNSKE